MTREVVTTERDAAIQQLRDVGLRVTAPRLEILHILTGGGHMDVETLAVAAREKLGALTSQAVYEMLRHFLETGLVTKFDRPGLPAVFEIAGTPHHHALCSLCGRVDNVTSAPLKKPGNDLSGWDVHGSEIVFKGICPDCSATARN
ncbi:Fur family transcriptional regulator [Streptomyces sp. NBC_01306]|uniref:Fur family transcriptional regulator n=1 Tax=Streptomyces sp. NBC_01306 TaxID=2903819 RepID=UPI0022592451|nr:transcriptional repressor [Streptomyces sp. NBC_01306]MCX4729128.1 transcriptional repressor [Streptomyces sp. NBC_01306]